MSIYLSEMVASWLADRSRFTRIFQFGMYTVACNIYIYMYITTYTYHTGYPCYTVYRN